MSFAFDDEFTRKKRSGMGCRRDVPTPMKSDVNIAFRMLLSLPIALYVRAVTSDHEWIRYNKDTINMPLSSEARHRYSTRDPISIFGVEWKPFVDMRRRTRPHTQLHTNRRQSDSLYSAIKSGKGFPKATITPRQRAQDFRIDNAEFITPVTKAAIISLCQGIKRSKHPSPIVTHVKPHF
jgi:hypothetical protein